MCGYTLVPWTTNTVSNFTFLCTARVMLASGTNRRDKVPPGELRRRCRGNGGAQSAGSYVFLKIHLSGQYWIVHGVGGQLGQSLPILWWKNWNDGQWSVLV